MPTGAEIMPGLWLFTSIAIAVSMVVLGAGQLVFRRLEGRFAQDL
jgi:ABC-2 type transport system permease protein